MYMHIIQFQIVVSTLSLLTDKDLNELGVERMGDRALLRKRCRDSQQSKWVIRILYRLAMIYK